MSNDIQAERKLFENAFPLAVFDIALNGYTEGEFTYAFLGWACRAALSPQEAKSSANLHMPRSSREAFTNFLIRELGPNALATGKISIIEAAEKAWNAALATQLPPAVPEGWQLMPKVPTREMLEAARRAPMPLFFTGDISAHRDRYFVEKYTAMRAVTPTPEVAASASEAIRITDIGGIK